MSDGAAAEAGGDRENGDVDLDDVLALDDRLEVAVHRAAVGVDLGLQFVD